MQQPPETHSAPQPRGAGFGRRPGRVTAAAVLLFVLGGLNILIGIFVVSASSALSGAGVDSGVFTVAGVVSIVIGALQVGAGVMVLRMQDRGRLLGVIVSAVALALALISLFGGEFLSIIGVALNAVVLYLLGQERGAFKR